GANHGQTIWRHAGAPVIGSVVTADLRGTGHQDVIVATTSGVDMLDGKTGAFLGQIGSGFAFQNSALVTQDPNGTIGITIAGYNGHAQGVISHYEIPGSNGSRVGETGAWPMFHHDRRLRGFAGL